MLFDDFCHADAGRVLTEKKFGSSAARRRKKSSLQKNKIRVVIEVRLGRRERGLLLRLLWWEEPITKFEVFPVFFQLLYRRRFLD